LVGRGDAIRIREKTKRLRKWGGNYSSPRLRKPNPGHGSVTNPGLGLTPGGEVSGWKVRALLFFCKGIFRDPEAREETEKPGLPEAGGGLMTDSLP